MTFSLKNLTLLGGSLFLMLMTTPLTGHAAAPSCSSLKDKLNSPVYRATESEIRSLNRRYPKIRQNVEKTVQAIMAMNIAKEPITRLGQIKEQGSLRSFNTNDMSDPDKLANLNPRLKRQILNVYNLLLDKQQFASYVRQLMLDTAVLMMKNQDQSTFRLENMEQPLSAKTNERTTKREFLLLGQIDHQSMMKVLVGRVRDRGDDIAVILSGQRGGFENNTTRTQRYENFYEVPARGPFIDLYFGRGSSHGQEGHLLQMDFVEQILTNRRQFWSYATNKGSGDWVWDSLFDGTNSTLMHPEFFGPVLRRTIPLY